MGLLLLRGAGGVIAVIQGCCYFASPDTPSLWTSVVGLLMILAGFSLLIGFLTPLAGSMVGLAVITIAFGWLLPAPVNLFDAVVPAILMAIVPAAIVFLGPGAFSIDARMFGRRQIIIPHSSRSEL